MLESVKERLDYTVTRCINWLRVDMEATPIQGLARTDQSPTQRGDVGLLIVKEIQLVAVIRVSESDKASSMSMTSTRSKRATSCPGVVVRTK